jgi:uncharacterized protein
MEKIPGVISDFFKENRVASVSFVDDEGKPYCINCFFVFDAIHRVLIFKSSRNSFHERYVRSVKDVAGSVLPDKINYLKPVGIQFTGKTLSESEIKGLGMEEIYYSRLPFGRMNPGYIWAIRPEYIKLTDSTALFGKKTIWNIYRHQPLTVNPSL